MHYQRPTTPRYAFFDDVVAQCEEFDVKQRGEILAAEELYNEATSHRTLEHRFLNVFLLIPNNSVLPCRRWARLKPL